MSLKKGGLYVCPYCGKETEDVDEIAAHVQVCEKRTNPDINAFIKGIKPMIGMMMGLWLMDVLLGKKKKGDDSERPET